MVVKGTTRGWDKVNMDISDIQKKWSLHVSIFYHYNFLPKTTLPIIIPPICLNRCNLTLVPTQF